VEGSGSGNLQYSIRDCG